MGRSFALVFLVACGSSDGALAPLLTTPVTAPTATRDVGPVEPSIADALPLPSPPSFDVAPPADRVVSLARGARHACVVRASGAVDCWGQHRTCERPGCDVDHPADPSVRRVPGIDDATSLDPTARCVVRKSGKVACFDAERFEMHDMPGLADARAIGEGARCAIVGAGAVSCRVDRTDEWRSIDGVRNARSIAVFEDYHVCVTHEGGGVSCGTVLGSFSRVSKTATEVVIGKSDWGRDPVTWVCVREQAYRCVIHQGGGDPEMPPSEQALPELTRFATGTQLDVSADGGRISAIVDGRVVVQGPTVTRELSHLADGVTLVDGCAVRETGAVVCWGSNDGGALAQPTTMLRTDVPPTIVLGLANVKALALGSSTAWALTRDGRVLGWGFHDERDPESGRERSKISTVPVETVLGEAGGDLVALAATETGQPCVRHRSGRVWCKPYHRPWSLLEIENVRALGAGVATFVAGKPMRTHALRERYGSSVRALDHLAGVELPEHRDAIAVGAGCALTDARRVRCGTTTLALENVTAIAAGREHICAIHDRRLACWHAPDDKPHSEPRGIPGIDEVFDIAATWGGRFCAVHDGGRLSCWSADDTTPKLEQVMPRDAIDVELAAVDKPARAHWYDDSASGPYGCAIRSDRRVACWGSNMAGALGDGSVLDSAAPVGVKL